jgi:hypothetical protein
MASTWTLSLNGQSRPLAGWGIDAIRFTRRSLEADELGFQLKKADALAEPAFDVELKRPLLGETK